jgi:hypothetical protein
MGILGFLALVIVNARSDVGLRFTSYDADLVFFFYAVLVSALALVGRALFFIKGWQRVAFAVVGLLVLLLWLVATVLVLQLESAPDGVERRPTLGRVDIPSGRVVAYLVQEGFPAGADTVLRLEHTVLPGVLFVREIAVVDASPLTLGFRAPHAVCVDFDYDGPVWGRPSTWVRVVVPLSGGRKVYWARDAEPVAPGTPCAAPGR